MELNNNEMTEPDNQLDFLLDYGFRSKSVAKKHLHEFTTVREEVKQVVEIV